MKSSPLRVLFAVGWVCAALLGVGSSGCDSDSNVVLEPRATVCAAGSSVACTGPDACAGQQACNVEGSGFGACRCGGDPGPTDAGSTPPPQTDGAAEGGESDAAAAPTTGGLRVQWTFVRDGSPIGCADIAGASGLALVLTPGAGAAIDKRVSCEATSDVVGLPVGAYTANASVVNGSGQALGSGGPYPAEARLAPCDAVVSGSCLSTLAVTIAVPSN